METILYTPFWLDSAGKLPPIWSSRRAGDQQPAPLKGTHMDLYDALDLDPATATAAELSAAVDRLSWGVPPHMGFEAAVATDELLAALEARG